MFRSLEALVEPTAAGRLDEVIRLLRRHPAGMTSNELAAELGVDASTIRRALARARAADIGLRRRGRRYTLNFARAPRALRLTSHETLALYLACRLLTRQQSDRNPHAEAVMRKLADATRDDAPRFAQSIEDAAALVRALPVRESYLAALETLTQAWSEGRVVAMSYRNQSGEVSDRRFAPYCIEPYGETNSTYAVGFDEKRGDIRTFRLDRMLAVELTDDHFELPLTFNPSRFFSQAWGVVWHDWPPVAVRLRFFGDAARLVQESFWHPSQRVTPQADGTCFVDFAVTDPLEMRRWIQQWGSEVEALAPLDLRKALAEEAVRAATRYDVAPSGSV